MFYRCIPIIIILNYKNESQFILFVENLMISLPKIHVFFPQSPSKKQKHYGRCSFKTLLFDNIVSVYWGDHSLSAVHVRSTGPGGLVSSPRSLNYVSVVFYGHPGSSVLVTAPLIGHRHSG